MRRIARRYNARGVSLVELLIVLAMIGILGSLSVPVLLRLGLFGGNKAQQAARDLFSALKAARIYANTYNVETAIAYNASTEYEDSAMTGFYPPVIDQFAMVRKLSKAEIENIERRSYEAQSPITLDTVSDVLFVPVTNSNGKFRKFREGTCVLPDIFEVETDSNCQPTTSSQRGLKPIVIWDIENFTDGDTLIDFFPPRSNYDLFTPVTLANIPDPATAFPAHIFKPGGALDARIGSPERVSVRVGLLPDQQPEERFVISPDDPAVTRQGVNQCVGLNFNLPVRWNLDAQKNQAGYPVFGIDDGDTNPLTFLSDDVHIEIEMFVVSGRVQIAS